MLIVLLISCWVFRRRRIVNFKELPVETELNKSFDNQSMAVSEKSEIHDIEDLTPIDQDMPANRLENVQQFEDVRKENQPDMSSFYVKQNNTAIRTSLDEEDFENRFKPKPKLHYKRYCLLKKGSKDLKNV